MRMTFDGGVEWEGLGAVPPAEGAGRLVGLVLEEAVLDTARFRSRDAGPRREGVVSLGLDGQATELTFGGRGRVDLLPHGPVLAWVGPAPGPRALALDVVESDAATREVLAGVGGVAGFAAGLPWPGAAPAAGLVSALLLALRHAAGDAREVVVRGVVPGALPPGSRGLLRAGGGLLRLTFGALDLGPAVGPGGDAVVEAGLLGLEIEAGALVEAPPGDGPRPRGGRTAPPRPRRVRLGRVLPLEGGVQALELRSGRTRAAVTLPSGEAAAGRVQVRGWPALEVSLGPVRAGRRLVPFALSWVLHPPRPDPEPWYEAARAALPEAQSLAGRSRKALPSLPAALAGLGPPRLGILAFDGLLALLPEREPPGGGGDVSGESASEAPPDGPALLSLAPDGPGRWSRTLVRPVLWRGAEVGEARVGLAVRRAAE